ncbi:hypothetical protein AW40_16335 [Kosakonia radicincitans UMEnt01/12]|nr:hypothetical protein AW40_16335 [Kosakonia radicincitans UMEnt01/12]
MSTSEIFSCGFKAWIQAAALYQYKSTFQIKKAPIVLTGAVSFSLQIVRKIMRRCDDGWSFRHDRGAEHDVRQQNYGLPDAHR